MGFRLTTLMPGISHLELINLNQKLTLNYIIHNPLNLIYNSLQLIVNHIFKTQSILLLRLVSVILGFFTMIFFSLALKFWYGNKTALLGMGLFITSPWVISVSRIATIDVQFLFGISLLLLLSSLLKKRIESPSIYIIINFVLTLLIFIPGLIWFVIALIAIQRGDIYYGIKLQNKISLPLYLIFSIICLPLLVINLIKSTTALSVFLGLNFNHFNIISKLKDFGEGIIHSFLLGPNNPSIWLGRYPMFNIFGLVCVVLGIYFYVIHFNNNQSKILFSFLLIGLILLGLNKSNSLSLVIPVLYLFLATGISYLLQIWLKLFPINPIARSLGIVLLIILISLSILFNTRQYFVAFANNPTSRSSFEIKLKD